MLDESPLPPSVTALAHLPLVNVPEQQSEPSPWVEGFPALMQHTISLSALVWHDAAGSQHTLVKSHAVVLCLHVTVSLWSDDPLSGAHWLQAPMVAPSAEHCAHPR